MNSTLFANDGIVLKADTVLPKRPLAQVAQGTAASQGDASQPWGLQSALTTFVASDVVGQKGFLWGYRNVDLEQYRKASVAFQHSPSIVVIGMGGSALGLRALLDGVNNENGKPCAARNIDVLDSLNTQRIQRARNAIREGAHLVVISKSGKTLETHALAKTLLMEIDASKMRKHVSVVTGEQDNPLKSWAQERGLVHWLLSDEIGGRFSALTSIALWPLFLTHARLGHALSELEAHMNTLIASPHESLGAALAQTMLGWHHIGVGHWILFEYASPFRAFGAWFEQLLNESIGKKGGGITPTVGNTSDHADEQRGAQYFRFASAFDAPAAQHSVLQNICQGEGSRSLMGLLWEEREELAIEVGSNSSGYWDSLGGLRFSQLNRSSLEATLESLREEKHPTSLLVAPNTLSARMILMMNFQVATILYAYANSVNPYGQPGVERGKKLLQEALQNLKT